MNQNKNNKLLSNIFLCTAIVASMLLFSAPTAFAFASPSAVNLGTAGDFSILSKAGISTTGVTAVVGDIGVSPIDHTAITGFTLNPVTPDAETTFATSSLVTGKVYAANYNPPTPAKMTTAIGDMGIAYTDTLSRATTDPAETNPGNGAGEIGGLILAPGVYVFDGASSNVIITADLTLNGGANDVWIFQIPGTLNIASCASCSSASDLAGSKVKLTGGAQASNVFWAAAGVVTLGTYSTFNGNIMTAAPKTIAIQTGAVLNGRALSQGAVTLDANIVTGPQVPVLTTIVVSPLAANVVRGIPLQLTATSLDQFGAPIAAVISYASNNLAVATVDAATGLVTAVDTGIATITASSGAVSGSSAITVSALPPPPVIIVPSGGGGTGGAPCIIIRYNMTSPAFVTATAGTATIPVTLAYIGTTCSGTVNVTAKVPAGWTATSVTTKLLGQGNKDETVLIELTMPSNAATSAVVLTGTVIGQAHTYSALTTVNVAAAPAPAPTPAPAPAPAPAPTPAPITGKATAQNDYTIPAIVAVVAAVALYLGYKLLGKGKKSK